MEIVKKNLISFICLAVALAAVAVAFTMLPGRRDDLQTKLNERKAAYETLHGLMSKPRQLPSVDPDHPDQQQQLPQFPNSRIIEQGDAIMQQMQKESAAIVQAAVKMNQHALLLPGSLPAPSTGVAIQFRNVYRSVLPPVEPTMPTTALNSQFAKDLHAGMPPVPADVALQQAQLEVELKKKMIMFAAGGQATNEQQVQQVIEQKKAELPKELMRKTVDTCKCYIDAGTFEHYSAITSAAGAPQATEIYWAQLNYWIQSDVVAAIVYANRDAKSIKDAPVKHLIAFRSGLQNQPGQQLQPGMPAFIAIPGQASSDPDGELKPNIAVSPTGRISNGLYDVFHFTVVADVEAAHVGDFLRALGYQRFITPFSADIKAVDNAVELGKGYMYGDTPMLNVTVPCEILYLRRWNAPFIPQTIKTMLGIQAEQPGAQPAAPAQQAAAAGNGP